MSFILKILGANSATPAYGRHQSAQLLAVGKYHFLIDCGEGTQDRLVEHNVNKWKVNHIFISHLHGDHYLGLMPLLFTMHLLKRSHDLHLYAQRGLQEIIIAQLKCANSTLNYKIIFHELDPHKLQLLFENDHLSAHSFPLNHRVPCCGFLFKEKPKPFRIDKEKMPPDIPLQAIFRLKQGQDYTDEQAGIIYKKEELTLPPKKSRIYAYCSDTCYDERIIPYIKGADLLYHEATFLAEEEKWAGLTFHSTTRQAGSIAKAARVQQLVIGHYSARYKDLTPFLNETTPIFPNTRLAVEGETIEVSDQ